MLGNVLETLGRAGYALEDHKKENREDGTDEEALIPLSHCPQRETNVVSSKNVQTRAFNHLLITFASR